MIQKQPDGARGEERDEVTEDNSSEQIREAVLAWHASQQKSLHGVRKLFLESSEFRSSLSKISLEDSEFGYNFVGVQQLSHDEIVARFLPAWEGKGEEGFWTDFLGTKTRCSSLPSSCAHLSGVVDGTPA